MKRIPPSRVMKQEADAILEGYVEEGPPLEALARLGARYMLQVALEEEVTAFLGRGHYEHGSPQQAGWRNGYQPVTLRGPDGNWELFRPKVRATEEPFRSVWARRIRLGREDLQALVAGMYVRGLSTRDIQDLYTQVFGQPVLSKSQVSRIAARLGPVFDQWRNRDLSHLKVVYLFLDGNYHAVRQGTSEKEGILCAYGITEEGKKVFIHLALGSRESYDAWLAFLHDLRSRGLKEPLLVIADGNPGLRKAAREVFPRAYFQRCLVHKMRNILAKLPKGAVGAIKPLLQQVFYAENQALAHRRARSLIRRFEGRFPSAMECLSKDLEECLTYLQFPREHHRHIRTTNLLERTFGEGRRRTKVIPRFPTETSCLRLLFAALVTASEKWRGVKMTPSILRQLDELRELRFPLPRDPVRKTRDREREEGFFVVLEHPTPSPIYTEFGT